MKLEEAFICVDCDEVFTSREDVGLAAWIPAAGAGRNRFPHLDACPSCTSRQIWPLGRFLLGPQGRAGLSTA